MVWVKDRGAAAIRPDSERFRSVRGTCRPLCGRLRAQQADCGGGPSMSDMWRREFITLLGGAAAAWPIVANAQQPVIPVVGWLGSGSAEPLLVAALHRGLREAGF